MNNEKQDLIDPEKDNESSTIEIRKEDLQSEEFIKSPDNFPADDENKSLNEAQSEVNEAFENKDNSGKERVGEILAEKNELYKQIDQLHKEQMSEQLGFQDELIQGCHSIDELEDVITKFGGLVRQEEFGSSKYLAWLSAESLLHKIKRVEETGELRRMYRVSGMREKLAEILGIKE